MVLATLLKKAAPAWLAGWTKSGSRDTGEASSAERIGPERVILTAKYADPGLGPVAAQIVASNDPFSVRDGEESVLVTLEVSAHAEERVTLKVKSTTKSLLLTFADQVGRVKKSEYVSIK